MKFGFQTFLERVAAQLSLPTLLEESSKKETFIAYGLAH
jgi:hypothetical protein